MRNTRRNKSKWFYIFLMARPNMKNFFCKIVFPQSDQQGAKAATWDDSEINFSQKQICRKFKINFIINQWKGEKHARSEGSLLDMLLINYESACSNQLYVEEMSKTESQKPHGKAENCCDRFWFSPSVLQLL